jgi:hypothetical protein
MLENRRSECAGEQVVTFTLQTRRLGQIKLPCKVHAVGSALPPIEFILAAKSIGPSVTCKHQDGTICSAISFGKISVLHAHHHVLSLHNESLIPADIKALITGGASVFSVDTHECTLQAGESMELTVTVHLDETFAFSDTLQILAANGSELEIPVSANGTGSTLYCEQVQNEQLDFKHQLAGTPFSETVVVENHGRRTCNAWWQNLENEKIKKKWGKALRGPGGKPDFSLIPVAERAVFSVQPEKAIIPSKQCLSFVISGFAPTEGLKQECLQLIAGQEVCMMHASKLWGVYCNNTESVCRVVRVGKCFPLMPWQALRCHISNSQVAPFCSNTITTRWWKSHQRRCSLWCQMRAKCL